VEFFDEGSSLQDVAAISQPHLRLCVYLLDEALVVALSVIALLGLMLLLVSAAILVSRGMRLGLLWFSAKLLRSYRSPAYTLKDRYPLTHKGPGSDHVSLNPRTWI
jgi:hypothetical protein